MEGYLYLRTDLQNTASIGFDINAEPIASKWSRRHCSIIVDSVRGTYLVARKRVEDSHWLHQYNIADAVPFASSIVNLSNYNVSVVDCFGSDGVLNGGVIRLTDLKGLNLDTVELRDRSRDNAQRWMLAMREAQNGVITPRIKPSIDLLDKKKKIYSSQEQLFSDKENASPNISFRAAALSGTNSKPSLQTRDAKTINNICNSSNHATILNKKVLSSIPSVGMHTNGIKKAVAFEGLPPVSASQTETRLMASATESSPQLPSCEPSQGSIKSSAVSVLPSGARDELEFWTFLEEPVPRAASSDTNQDILGQTLAISKMKKSMKIGRKNDWHDRRRGAVTLWNGFLFILAALSAVLLHLTPPVSETCTLQLPPPLPHYTLPSSMPQLFGISTFKFSSVSVLQEFSKQASASKQLVHVAAQSQEIGARLPAPMKTWLLLPAPMQKLSIVTPLSPVLLAADLVWRDVSEVGARWKAHTPAPDYVRLNMEEMSTQQPVPVIQEVSNQIPEASGSALDLRSVPEDTVPAVVQTQGIEPEEAKLPGGTRSLVRAVTSPLRLIGWLVAQMV